MQSCFGRFAGYQKLEDQESQLQEQEPGCLGQWPTKRPRFTKPGWTTTCIILVDLALFGLLLYSLRDLFFLLRHNKEMFSAHVNVTLQDQPKHVHSSRQIPRILHQTCKNETIPEMWAESQQSCLKAYSDFEYKVRLTAHHHPLWKNKPASNLNSSFGPTSELASFCRPSTLGFWKPGTLTLFLSNAPMPYATLSFITMAVFTSTWTPSATRPSRSTKSKPS